MICIRIVFFYWNAGKKEALGEIRPRGGRGAAGRGIHGFQWKAFSLPVQEFQPGVFGAVHQKQFLVVFAPFKVNISDLPEAEGCEIADELQCDYFLIEDGNLAKKADREETDNEQQDNPAVFGLQCLADAFFLSKCN